MFGVCCLLFDLVRLSLILIIIRKTFVSAVQLIDVTNKVAQVATETSAPFDQRFAFKFKCFLLTGSKSSMPTDDASD